MVDVLDSNDQTICLPDSVTRGYADSGDAMSTTAISMTAGDHDVIRELVREVSQSCVTSVQSADTDPDQNKPGSQTSRAGNCSRDVTPLVIASSLLLFLILVLRMQVYGT